MVLLTTAIAILALDHLTKWLVVTHLTLGQQVRAVGPLTIDYVQNNGAAFSLFPQFHYVYLVVAAAVAIYIVFFGHRLGDGFWHQVVLGAVLGGALSNGVDRLLFGYVVDFVDFHFWPVFNVADSAIVIGVIVGVLTFRPKEHGSSVGEKI